MRALVVALSSLMCACARTGSSEAGAQSVASPVAAVASREVAQGARHGAQPDAAASSPSTAGPLGVPSPAASLNGPQIFSASSTPHIVHTGDAVTWTVLTTPDVVSVSAHVSFYTVPLQRQAAGRFVRGFTIPHGVPSIFHGTYTVIMTAKTQDGTKITRSVSMTFQ